MTIKVLETYKEIIIDSNSRFKSWEHCYLFFKENRKKDVPVSDFSLHLFAYLASWGMLRGSSFLLQKDYLFHNDIVKEILNEKYDSLLEVNPLSLDSTKLDLLFSLKSKIKELYFNNTKIYKGQPNGGKNATDTLITKIMLGTLGCVPAYDRYFIDGLKEEGFKSGSFSRKSLLEISDYYKRNKDEIINIQRNIENESNIKYPIMKIIDMEFWQIGFELTL